MKKKRSGIIAVLMGLLVLTSVAAPALAQNEEEVPAGTGPMPRAELAIVAPRMAPVGEEVSMTVFERQNQTPVKDAGIWALTRENAEALKEETAAIREQGGNAAQELDWESVVSAYGFFLGTTQGNGQLKYTFTEGGWYLLVAVKQGYIPGRTGIAIRTMLQALAIEAPRRAAPGETVTMTVFQRGTEDPVRDAGIWALTRENAEALKAEIDAIREGSDNAVQELDWESLVSAYGFFLGTSQGNGQLKYTFTEEGGYLLIAIKQGYMPGRTGIAIRAMPQVLAIQAQGWAFAGEEVTMTVFNMQNQDPVKDAGIWALTRENAETLKAEIDAIREGSDNAVQELDWESLVSAYGVFLGTTQGNGQLKYTFTEVGWYLLVTVKEGYIPGRTGIAIRAIPSADTLWGSGVPGEVPSDAPGLRKGFNGESQGE